MWPKPRESGIRASRAGTMAKRPNKKRRRKFDARLIEGGLEHVLAMRLNIGRKPTVATVEKRSETFAANRAREAVERWRAAARAWKRRKAQRRHPNIMRGWRPDAGQVEIVGGRYLDRLVMVMAPGEWYAGPDIGELTGWSLNTRQAILYQEGVAKGYVERRRAEGMPAGRLKGRFNGALGPRVLFGLTPKGEALAELNRMLG